MAVLSVLDHLPTPGGISLTARWARTGAIGVYTRGDFADPGISARSAGGESSAPGHRCRWIEQSFGPGALVGAAAKGTIITPHPGEMGRLVWRIKGIRRRYRPSTTGTRQSEEWQVTLVLKGACTLIAETGWPLVYQLA